MSVPGVCSGGVALVRCSVAERWFARGVGFGEHRAAGVLPRRHSGALGLLSGRKRCSTVSCAPHDDSFFFRPSRGGEPLDSATPQNSELIGMVAGLEEGGKERMLACVSSDAKQAIAATVATTFGVVTGKDIEVSVKGSYFPLYATLLSCLCAGYNLRAMEARMHLESLLEQSPPTDCDDDDYVGEATGLSPEVRAQLPSEVAGYIASLEARVEKHEKGGKAKKAAAKKAFANPLTEYVLRKGPGKVLRMTSSPSLEVTGAFNSVAGNEMEKFGAVPLKSINLGEGKQLKVGRKAFMNAVEWCLLAGYFIRSEEYRIALDECYSKEGAQKEANNSLPSSWLGRIRGFFRGVFTDHSNECR